MSETNLGGTAQSGMSSSGHHNLVDDALSAVGVGKHQALLFLYVGGCWMSDAMEVMLVAVLAPAVACEWGTSPEGQSLLASAVFIGMMLASSGWGVVADIAGRKAAFACAAALAACSGLASSLAPSFGWLVALRLLVGCGLVGVLPMYTLLEEWLPAKSGHKGKWLVALQAYWSIGTVLEALLAWWLLNSFGWRALLAASAVPIACILAALPLVPESPHYLAGCGRLADAHRALAAAAARNGTSERLRRVLQGQQQQQQQQERLQHNSESWAPGEPPRASRERQPVVGACGHQGALHQQSSPPPALLPYRAAGGSDHAARDRRGRGQNGGSTGEADKRRTVGQLVYAVNGDAQPASGPFSPATSARPSRDSDGGSPGGVAASGVHLEVDVAAGGAGGSSTITAAAGCVEGCCGCVGSTCQACLRALARGSTSGPDAPGGCCVQVVRARQAAGGPGTWWTELVDLLRILLGRELRNRTVRLAVTWFACALSYYGVVMLVPYVAAGGGLRAGGVGGAGGAADGAAAGNDPAGGSGGDGGGGNGGCQPWFSGAPGSHLVLPASAYWSMMAAAAAELPSLAWAFLAVDRWSRRRTVALGLAATAASLAPVVMALAGGGPGGAAAIASAYPPPPPPPSAQEAAFTRRYGWRRRRLQPAWLVSTAASRWLPLTSVTLARLFVSGAFTLLYVLTPEQYPPRVHGSALGAANTLARVGALAAPFVAVALPQRGDLPTALALLAGTCGIAAAAVSGLPDGPKGV